MVYLRDARGIVRPIIQLVVVPACVCSILDSAVSPLYATVPGPVEDDGAKCAAK